MASTTTANSKTKAKKANQGPMIMEMASKDFSQAEQAQQIATAEMKRKNLERRPDLPTKF